VSVDYHVVLEEMFRGKSWSVTGDEYSGLEWRDASPKPSQAELDALWGEARLASCLKMIRDKRGFLLVASDWTQLVDAPVDREAWATYRQALRDMPTTVVDADNVVWPEHPK